MDTTPAKRRTSLIQARLTPRQFVGLQTLAPGATTDTELLRRALDAATLALARAGLMPPEYYYYLAVNHPEGWADAYRAHPGIPGAELLPPPHSYMFGAGQSHGTTAAHTDQQPTGAAQVADAFAGWGDDEPTTAPMSGGFPTPAATQAPPPHKTPVYIATRRPTDAELKAEGQRVEAHAKAQLRGESVPELGPAPWETTLE